MIIKFGIFCSSVVVMLMAAVLIVIIHIAKLIRKFGYERNPFRKRYLHSRSSTEIADD